jgi:hypothetical protein
MKNRHFLPKNIYVWCFPALVLAYCFAYAPYGINETDGGFITGLGWQVLSGKVLYQDIIYVRPPLPVWLRSIELWCLPEQWSILGERWVFYWKVALYSWLSAALLLPKGKRLPLAMIGFVVSVHCYPAAAWHTVDGILFSVAALFALFQLRSGWGIALAAVCLFAALLCKQSFYPLAPVMLLAVFFTQKQRNAWLFVGFLGAFTAFFALYLSQNGLLDNYLAMTMNATSSGQALEHGILDFFRIQPALCLFSALCCVPVFYWKKRYWYWIWLLGVLLSYAFAIWKNQDFTAPFAASRLLFDLSIVYAGAAYFLGKWTKETLQRVALLLCISWCAAVSWGYNLPILLSSPWVYTCMAMSKSVLPVTFIKHSQKVFFAVFFALLGLFYGGYQFVYRDGKRAEMDTAMGPIFPVLNGIYSTRETADLYRDLQNIAQKYPQMAVFPAFPQASFLLQRKPLMPLDWTVRREMGGFEPWLDRALQAARPVLVLEKKYKNELPVSKEYAWLWETLQKARLIDETPYFEVYSLK